MKFDPKDAAKGLPLDVFKSNWIDATIHENGILMGLEQISAAQLLVINLFCGSDEAYCESNDMTISTKGPAQMELEALFRGRGRALATMLISQGARRPPA